MTEKQKLAEALKPCTFCGGQTQFMRDEGKVTGRVICRDCRTSTRLDYESDAVKLWNTRAHLETLNAGGVVIKPHNTWKPKDGDGKTWAEGYVCESALSPCGNEVERAQENAKTCADNQQHALNLCAAVKALEKLHGKLMQRKGLNAMTFGGASVQITLSELSDLEKAIEAINGKGAG